MISVLALTVSVANDALELIVHGIAVFLAMILNHPAVNEAGANIIVAGAKKLCHEDDLDVHTKALSERLTKNMEQDAVQAGNDFPTLCSNFVKGVVVGKKSTKKTNDKDEQNNEIVQEKELKVVKRETDDSSAAASTKSIGSDDDDDDDAPQQQPQQQKKGIGQFFKDVLAKGNNKNTNEAETTNSMIDTSEDSKGEDLLVDFDGSVPTNEEVTANEVNKDEKSQDKPKGLGGFLKGVMSSDKQQKTEIQEEKKEDNEDQGDEKEDDKAEENVKDAGSDTQEATTSDETQKVKDDDEREEKAQSAEADIENENIEEESLKEDGSERQENESSTGLGGFVKGVMSSNQQEDDGDKTQDKNQTEMEMSKSGDALIVGFESMEVAGGLNESETQNDGQPKQGLGEFMKGVLPVQASLKDEQVSNDMDQPLEIGEWKSNDVSAMDGVAKSNSTNDMITAN